MALHHIRDLKDPLAGIIRDDPVRPHIPIEQRINDAAEILLLQEGEEVLAAMCLQWLSEVPENEQDLISMNKDKDVAVFYTIWSYKPGAGAQLIQEAAKWIHAEYAVKSIVTLSPQTEMARRFHLKNGARVRRENLTSVNYEYYNKE